MTTHTDDRDFGSYELLARIGEGPRGPVFVARRPGDAATEVLYVVALSTFATGEDELMRAFVRDVETIARLRHPHVLGVVEIGVNTAGHYVVMEHVDGASLSAVQDRHRAIRPPRLVMTTMLDALDGLHAAHSIREDGAVQPVVHGSLSSDSLLLGLDGACRITGFGHVRPRVQTKPSHRNTTATGYLAPEQVTGDALDPRTDVFALGVVLWNALTGRRLFHDRVEHMTMSNVLERKIPRPSTIGLCPPPALDAVVMKALERDPDHRFQSASEMAGALRAAARAAACLAAGTEVGEWLTTTFGSELAVRRHAIRELINHPAPRRQIPVLASPGSAPSADSRDELSLDELARASAAPPRRSTALAVAPIAYPPEPGQRRQLATVAAASLLMVGLLIAWRWSTVSAAPDVTAALDRDATEPAAGGPGAGPELEVTVLDVRTATIDPAVPATGPAAATAQGPAAASAPGPAATTTPGPAAATASAARTVEPTAITSARAPAEPATGTARTVEPTAITSARAPAEPAPGTAARTAETAVVTSAPAAATATAAPSSRTAQRPKKPSHPAAPARNDAHPEARTDARPDPRPDPRGDPAETRPVTPRTDAAPPRPAVPKAEPPARPTMEPNPYLYK
jgi:serine/threonine-protein kinase